MGREADFSAKNRPPLTDDVIADEIVTQVLARGPGRTICPSDVARALSPDWRVLMPDVRRVAASLPCVVATQKGRPVDADAARGPIRLGLAPSSGDRCV